MKFSKKEFYMYQTKAKGENQITFDEDVNVPDIKPDIRRMIQKKGEISLQEIIATEGRAHIQGTLHFQLLYVADTPEGEVESLEGSLPVSEIIYLDGVEKGDKVVVSWEIEDITLHIINSRKMNLKAVVSLIGKVEDTRKVVFPLEIEEENLSVRKKQLQVLTLNIHKKDTLRQKREIKVAQNKPDIRKIIWSEINICGIETRVGEGEISVKGEIGVFVLYKGEDQSGTVEWIEECIPFCGNVPCADCAVEMIPRIDTTMLSGSVEAKPDEDGEQRILNVDVVLELDMRIYQEKNSSIIDDVYSPSVDCVPQRKKEKLEQLLVKNDSKCKVTSKVSVDGAQGKILQICHGSGIVKIDQTEMREDGIWVQGAVQTSILYCIGDDEMPFYSMDTAVPFEHLIQAEGADAGSTYELTAVVENLAIVMLDSNDIEIKALIGLNTIVVRAWEENVITEIKEEPLDMEQVERMPGIVCYIVQPGDSLWDIARKFYTTADRIQEINGLEEDTLSPCQALLIVKEACS